MGWFGEGSEGAGFRARSSWHPEGAGWRTESADPRGFQALTSEARTRLIDCMGRASAVGRLSWPQIRQSDAYRGRWVALDNCTYDAKTAQPMEGAVVDSDEDLVELCTRIQQSDNKHCAILFCDDAPEFVLTPEPGAASPVSSRSPSSSRTPLPYRPYTH